MNKRLRLAACAAVAIFASVANAQEKYPSRAVRLILPFPPGGGADISARTIAAKLTERFGQQVIVDNRPGAGGSLGSKIVADAVPDGYTRLSVSSGHTINPVVYKLPYDTRRISPALPAPTAPPSCSWRRCPWASGR